jgi:octaprenyl-diphosphate synthase
MLRVNQVITDNLASEVVLINQLSQHIILSGGKRLRPTLVILAARACRYQGETDALLAAVVEFIHTATLLHDDVVDDSDMPLLEGFPDDGARAIDGNHGPARQHHQYDRPG